ncbi:MAG: biotin/lipoyl-binding protein, partial [Magnetococcales bacterium]|nr:biotin/lipoyl-binding protein [Magnetococcales bacterium]
SDPDREGLVTVFFEINGQPRSITVQDSVRAKQKIVMPKARDGDPNQIGAPIPGTVGAIAVVKGQKIARGDLLLTLEAMKMETALCANQEGVVAEVHVTVGAQVDTKDLLITIAPK